MRISTNWIRIKLDRWTGKLLINENTPDLYVSSVDYEEPHEYCKTDARRTNPRYKNIFLNALKDLWAHQIKKKRTESPCMAATLYTDLFNLSRFSHVFQMHSPIQHITITNLNRHFTFSTYCIKCRCTQTQTYTHTHTRYPKREINIYGAISLNYSFALGVHVQLQIDWIYTHLYLLLYL